MVVPENRIATRLQTRFRLESPLANSLANPLANSIATRTSNGRSSASNPVFEPAGKKAANTCMYGNLVEVGNLVSNGWRYWPGDTQKGPPNPN